MNVFSFCVYGVNPKYCQGMVDNLREILKRFPDFRVYIYLGNDVPPDYVKIYAQFSNAVLVHVASKTTDLMVWRFFALDQPGVGCMFPRDADSRVNDRDEWCVRQFLASDKLLHLCRDHYWHKTKITGGMWGVKKSGMPSVALMWKEWCQKNGNAPVVYDDDQKFLSTCVYPIFPASAMLIHSNIVGHLREKVTPIPPELFSETNFVGNVWDYKDGVEFPVFKYSDYPLVDHVRWLQKEDQHALIAGITAAIDIYTVSDRTYLLDAMFVASFYLENYARCREIFGMFRSTHVDEHVLQNSNFLIPKLKKRVVGTSDPAREPAADEIVICYGKYPMDARALPAGNKMYRNAVFYSSLKHDVFEHHPCWADIGVIYILNLVERRDRFTEIMAELCAVGAPLDRVHHYKAEKKAVTGKAILDSYLGATKNHWDVVAHFMEKEWRHCLVLEDDFMFNSNVREVQSALQTFMARNYDYDVCLLATSKFGDIRPYDDLLNVSHQPCTTTSAYLLARATCAPVFECFREGYAKMLETGDTTTYVCDRYWARLQPRNRMFVFKDKLGYQRCGFSSILNTTSGFNLD